MAYQLGNMVSSASAQIEASESSPSDLINPSLYPSSSFSAAGGDKHTTTIQGPNGPEVVPDYAFVQGIFIGVIAAYVIVLTLLGPENHGSHFERSKTAFQAGASKDDLASVPGSDGARDRSSSESGTGTKAEKGFTRHVENGQQA